MIRVHPRPDEVAGPTALGRCECPGLVRKHWAWKSEFYAARANHVRQVIHDIRSETPALAYDLSQKLAGLN